MPLDRSLWSLGKAFDRGSSYSCSLFPVPCSLVSPTNQNFPPQHKGGNPMSKRITPDELADLAGTIPYEIMLGFAPRVPVEVVD